MSTTADQIRLGRAAAQLKSKVKPAKWRRIVRAAHRKGYTVAGALSDAPAPLKERTRKSLVDQAKKTVQVSYRPVEREVTREEKRVSALDAKRAADNRAYAEWLNAETGKLQAQARSADSALLDRQREIGAQSAQAWDDAQAAAAAAAGATAGNISAPGQANALDFSAAAARASGLVANQRDVSSKMVSSNERSMQLVSAAILAGASATDAKRQGETAEARAKLAGERAKIRDSKKGDIRGEVSRLLDLEMTKSQNNRDFAAAASKLGIDVQKLKLDFLKEKNDYKLDVATLNLNKWKERNTIDWRKAQNQLGYDRIVSQDGRAAADRALRKWIARRQKEKTQAGTRTATERKESRTTYRVVETLSDLLASGTTREKLLENYDSVSIEVAEDLIANGGRLSGVGWKKAKALGIAKFYSRVPADPNQGRPDAAQ